MLFVLEFVGYRHHPYCFTGTHFFLKLISGRAKMVNHLSQPFIAAVILWKQKRNVLCAYYTEALCQIISPAVEQIAKLILKFPNAYLN